MRKNAYCNEEYIYIYIYIYVIYIYIYDYTGGIIMMIIYHIISL